MSHVELGEEKLVVVTGGHPGLCLLSIQIPGAKKVWSSGQA